ncbi:MAG: hypothetical protein ABR521_08825 [Gaiellaceae bacterium]
MRRLFALLLALGAAAAAPAAVSDRSVKALGPVTVIARSGSAVAIASAPAGTECDYVQLWNLATRSFERLRKAPDDPCFQGPSTGSGIDAVSVSGNRLLWLEYGGGNLRDWVVKTATPGAAKPTELEFEEVDVEEPAPIVIGDGSQSRLPYSVNDTVKVLSPAGKRLYTWAAPDEVTALTSYRDRVAVLMAGGGAVVLSAAGRVAQTSTASPGVKSIRLGGAGVLFELAGGAVELRRGAQLVRTLRLPAGASVLDYAEGILIYSLGTKVRGVRVGTAKDVLLRDTGRRPVVAALEPNGLSYAVGKRVFSVAMVRVTARFG